MNTLERLKNAKELRDLAELLGFTPKGVSYILYKLPLAKKYRTFTIPKKAGGSRIIQAPEAQLALLQERLAERLNECVCEFTRVNSRFWQASHGFRKIRTIVSNADVHKRRRFVFNVDIKDFFGSINFGRVRGFFIHDRGFALTPQVSTIIAQIACHENSLPQGSPCSPIISNLIGNIVDLRMIALARHARCTYSRYADDLTFSTNERLFPGEIAVNAHGGYWITGRELRREIERLGFMLNDSKTRMSVRDSRQIVTGLVVNAKPNIEQGYYRSVRAMCHALFKDGEYYKPMAGSSETVTNLDPIEGMLSHIYFVKTRKDRQPKVNKLAEKSGEFHPPHAPTELYRRFLFYKNFVAPSAPVLVTEGISDITYLKYAIRMLATSFPSLVQEKGGKVERLIKFLMPSSTTKNVLNLGQGTAGQTSLVEQYAKTLNRYSHQPMAHPVIVLCDNDSGPKSLFKSASRKTTGTISVKSTEPYYYLGANLYLVKISEDDPPKEREIEDLFSKSLLETKVDGKPFDPAKEHGDATAYGKTVFADRVVRPNWREIDFSGFNDLLLRIAQCLAHYDSVKASSHVGGS